MIFLPQENLDYAKNMNYIVDKELGIERIR